MFAVFAWMMGIGLSVAGLVLAAAARSSGVHLAYVHMLIAAAVSISIALVAVSETRRLQEQGASRVRVAASTARHMGLVWTWGALVLAVTYGTGILTWKEWRTFFIAFTIGAGLCLSVSALLNKDAAQAREDATMLKLARYGAMAQLAGMLIAMIGLVVDGKMTRFLQIQREGWQDWAANNVFFFGALALAAISAYALSASREPSQQG
jgi:hypothetical protein